MAYYNIENEEDCPNMKLFLDDIRKFAEREGSWVIPILESTGPRSRPHQIHLWIFNSGYVDVAKTIADVFNEAFEPEVKKELPPEMVNRRKGHDFGFGDYVN